MNDDFFRLLWSGYGKKKVVIVVFVTNSISIRR